ncbi:DUF4328 domain-containing protein [Streptomyces sp. NBC_01565]|uniref:DUF4328 domain-containing protein n=1 Tax=Streptomyces sp. NBC_01565 TaxID=2975881 RepID=UPI00225309EC|nr:DUF4328 domain-containing protein [Streptomyces sp. NBC_01565]MCX4545015.1 DUF4328 domain-containing protein [Streptomyces sp. NBC_01565]
MSFSAPGSPPPPAVPPIPGHAPQMMPPVPAQPYAGQTYPGPQGPYPYPYPGQPVHPYPAPAAVDTLRSPHGLATALTVLLSVAALSNLYATGVCLYLWSLMDGLVTDPFKVTDRSLVRADDLMTVATVVQILITLATTVVFIVWFHRVRRNGEIFRPDAFTLSRGWAIGSWFIPLANLVMPFVIARQTWAASTQLAPDGSFRKVSTAPLTAWWLVFAASQIVDRVAASLFRLADTPEQLRGSAAVGVADGLLTLVAAVLAVLFVRKLTALQNTKATQGPYAAV